MMPSPRTTKPEPEPRCTDPPPFGGPGERKPRNGLSSPPNGPPGPNHSGGNPNCAPSAVLAMETTLIWTTAGDACATSGANEGPSRAARGATAIGGAGAAA